MSPAAALDWPRRSEDEAATRALGAELAQVLAPDGVLLLSGDLGTGKTVLAQGIAEGLGIDRTEVQSPTYTLIRDHQGPGGALVHLDLYRLEPDEVFDAGVEEALASPGVKVVEWAERLPFDLPAALWLEIVRVPFGRDVRLRTR